MPRDPVWNTACSIRCRGDVYLRRTCLMACCATALPTRESRADRGSSSSTTSALANSARAIATRCFWPPDMLVPRSPGHQHRASSIITRQDMQIAAMPLTLPCQKTLEGVLHETSIMHMHDNSQAVAHTLCEVSPPPHTSTVCSQHLNQLSLQFQGQSQLWQQATAR